MPGMMYTCLSRERIYEETIFLHIQFTCLGLVVPEIVERDGDGDSNMLLDVELLEQTLLFGSFVRHGFEPEIMQSKAA